MENKDCGQCKHMVKIVSCWCYRHLNSYLCEQERNNCVPVECYECCGLEAKFFVQKPRGINSYGCL